MHTLVKGQRRAAWLVLFMLILPLSVVVGCSNQSKGCLGNIPVEGDLTLSVAQSIVGKTVPVCATSSDDPNTPGQVLIEKPWENLYSVDGMKLPAKVNLSGSDNASSPLADCDVNPSNTIYIQSDGKWFKARSVGCSQLD